MEVIAGIVPAGLALLSFFRAPACPPCSVVCPSVTCGSLTCSGDASTSRETRGTVWWYLLACLVGVGLGLVAPVCVKYLRSLRFEVCNSDAAPGGDTSGRAAPPAAVDLSVDIVRAVTPSTRRRT